MKLPDQLHCPDCKGRLAAISMDALRCSGCERSIPVIDGIADFVGAAAQPGADRYHGAGAADLFARIQEAALDRWPSALGDTIELGCGRGETTQAIVAAQRFRSLLLVDTDMAMLLAARARSADLGPAPEQPVACATLTGGQDVLRDAVADTVIGTALLAGVGDVRGFLAMVHRVLRPNGRAMFVVPNRRYHEAMCLAMAEALVQRHARDGAWPEGQAAALELLAQTRRKLVHRGDRDFLAGLDVKHLFDSETLEAFGAETGFTTAEMIPLDPDPAGAETTQAICRRLGAPDGFTETFGGLAAAVGRRFFSLLGRQDQSATMLLWLTKGPGPIVRVFNHRKPPPVTQVVADAALGGVVPRWSVELKAQDRPGGIVVSLGGWCLCNTDVRWVRLTMDDVVRAAPVWRPRPDVHEVLNRSGLYHPLNALCSGMASELVFDGVHAVDNRRPFRLDIVLTNGLVVSGPAPDALVMDETMVIAH
jgi:SAM-dependent methyltransferase